MHYEQVIGVANEDRPLSPILNQFADRFLHPVESDIGQQARNRPPLRNPFLGGIEATLVQHTSFEPGSQLTSDQGMNLITHRLPPFLGRDDDRREPRGTVLQAAPELSAARLGAGSANAVRLSVIEIDRVACGVVFSFFSSPSPFRYDDLFQTMRLSFIVFLLSATAFGVPKVGGPPTKADTPKAPSSDGWGLIDY